MPTIVNLTKAAGERVPSPCDGCECGSASLSQYIDPKTGDLMEETTSCVETCERLRMWIRDETPGKRRDYGFGQNIRDALDVIRGRGNQ